MTSEDVVHLTLAFLEPAIVVRLQVVIDLTPPLHLVIIVITLLTDHIEELKAVLALVRADDSQPIPQLLLLEELLGQVLEVPSAELLVRYNLDLAIAQVGDVDGVAEVSCAAVNFDALLEKGCEGGWVEDAVVCWLGCVDGELEFSY